MLKTYEEAAAALAAGTVPVQEPVKRVRKYAIREAREAARLLDDNLKLAFGGPGAADSDEPLTVETLRTGTVGNGWRDHGPKQGCERYSKEIGKYRWCMGRKVVPFPAEALADFLSYFPTRFLWDANNNGCEIVSQVAPSTLVLHSLAKPVMGTNPREVCLSNTFLARGDRGGFQLFSRSIHHPRAAVPPGCTRATVPMGAWVVEPLTENECLAIYIASIDPGGSIPQFVVNAALPNRPPTMILAVEKCLASFELNRDRLAQTMKNARETAEIFASSADADDEDDGDDVLVDLPSGTLPGWLALCRPFLPLSMQRQGTVGRISVDIVRAAIRDRSVLTPRMYCAVAVGPLPAAPLTASQLELLRMKKLEAARKAALADAKRSHRDKTIVGSMLDVSTAVVGGVVGTLTGTVGTILGGAGNIAGAFGDALGITGGRNDITECGWPDASIEVLEAQGMPSFTKCHRYTTNVVAADEPVWDAQLEIPVLHSTLSSCLRLCVLESASILPGSSLPGVKDVAQGMDKFTPDKPIGECLIPLEDLARACHGGMAGGGRHLRIDRWVQLYRPGTCSSRYMDAYSAGKESWPTDLLSVPGSVADPTPLMRSGGGSASDKQDFSVDNDYRCRGWIRLRLALSFSSVSDSGAFVAERMEQLNLKRAARDLELEAAKSAGQSVYSLGLDGDEDEADSGDEAQSSDGSETLRAQLPARSIELRDAVESLHGVVAEAPATHAADSDLLRQLVPKSHAAVAAELRALPTALHSLGSVSSADGQVPAALQLLGRSLRTSLAAVAGVSVKLLRGVLSSTSWHQPVRSFLSLMLLLVAVWSFGVCGFASSAVWEDPKSHARHAATTDDEKSVPGATSNAVHALAFTMMFLLRMFAFVVSRLYSVLPGVPLSLPSSVVALYQPVLTLVAPLSVDGPAIEQFVNSSLHRAADVTTDAVHISYFLLDATGRACAIPVNTDIFHASASVVQAGTGALAASSAHEAISQIALVVANVVLTVWISIAQVTHFVPILLQTVVRLLPAYMTWWVWSGRRFRKQLRPGSDNRFARRHLAAGGKNAAGLAASQNQSEAESDGESADEAQINHQISEVFGRSNDEDPEKIRKAIGVSSPRKPSSAAVPAAGEPVCRVRLSVTTLVGYLADQQLLFKIGSAGGGQSSSHRRSRSGRLSFQEAVLAGGEVVLMLLIASIAFEVRKAASALCEARKWSRPVFSWTTFGAGVVVSLVSALYGVAWTVAVLGLLLLCWFAQPVLYVRQLSAAFEQYSEAELELQVA